MQHKAESECIRCGEDLAETYRVERVERDVFVINAVSAEWQRGPRVFPESIVTRSHQLVLCDDCFGKEYTRAKRACTAWPRRCNICATDLDDDNTYFFRITLTELMPVGGEGDEIILEERVPPHALTPDVFICATCTEEHVGFANACFIADIDVDDDDDDDEIVTRT